MNETVKDHVMHGGRPMLPLTPRLTPRTMDLQGLGGLRRTDAATAHVQTDARGPGWMA